MSLALLFHYLMLNMFRMLLHPSSGACDLCVELFHGLYCSGSMCVGVTLWYGCGGVVSVCRLQPIFIQHERSLPNISEELRSFELNFRSTSSKLLLKFSFCFSFEFLLLYNFTLYLSSMCCPIVRADMFILLYKGNQSGSIQFFSSWSLQPASYRKVPGSIRGQCM